MSQSDLLIENQARSSARTDIQAALQALGSCMKGPSAPATAYAGELWLDDDTPSATLWTLKQYDGTDWIPLFYIDTIANTATPVSGSTPAGLQGFISGWTWANNGSDPSHDIDIAAGRGVDTTGTAVLQGGAMTKRYDAAWAAGNGNGGRSGSAADGDWWIHVCYDVDDQLVDYVFSQSRTAPTLPSGYTLFVPIGWFRVASGSILATNVYALPGGGVEITWKTPGTDVTPTIGTSRSLVALGRVPSGISVQATLGVECRSQSAAVDICCPDQDDLAPAMTGGIGVSGLSVAMTGGFVNIASLKSRQRVRTNTSGEVAMRASVAGTLVYASVIGFEWSR